jgi:hypothetical protein
MPTFTVLASLHGPVRVASIIELQLVADGIPVKTITYNLLKYDGALFHEGGLRLEATLETTDIDSAVTIAELAMDRVAPLFAFSSSAEIPVAQIELAYDSTPGALRGDLIRFGYDGVPESRIRKIFTSKLLPFFADLADLPPSRRSPIERALWWYNLALTQESLANRFSMLWVALECLKNQLATRFTESSLQPALCPECKNQLRCSSCAHDLPPRKRANAGIAKLFATIPEGGARGFRRASDLRNAIEHGGRTYAEGEEDARLLMPMMEAAIPRGIARLLGYTTEHEESLIQPLVPVQPRRQIAARFNFERSSNTQLGLKGFHPRIELKARVQWFATHSGTRSSAMWIDALAYCGRGIVLSRAWGQARRRFEAWHDAPVTFSQSFEPPHPPHTDIHGVTLWELTPTNIPVGRPFRTLPNGAVSVATSSSPQPIILGE